MTLSDLRTLLDSLTENGMAENLPVFMTTGTDNAVTGSVCARLAVVEGQPALMLCEERDTPPGGLDEFHQATKRLN